jgi:hypothetical protein
MPRKARGKVGGVKCVDRAMNGLTRCQLNRNPHWATALNVNTDPTRMRGSGGRDECNEIISKRG